MGGVMRRGLVVFLICLAAGRLPAADVISGQSIQKAIDAAKEGDTVLVKPGTYTEYLRVTKSRLRLMGQPGAVIDVRQAFPAGWTKDLDWDPRGRVWNRKLPFRPGRMYWKGLNVEGIHPATMSGAANGWADNLRQKCTGRDLMRLESDDYYWTGGNVVWGYRNEDPLTVYVRFAEPERFAAADISFASEKPAIEVTADMAGVIIRGLTIVGGNLGIHLGTNAKGCIVEDNYISGCRDSVSLVGDGGSNIVRNNSCTLKHLKTLDPNHKDHLQVWRRFKLEGFKDGRGVALTNHGDNNQVYGNTIFEHWDGIQTVEDWGDPTPAKRTRVFNNVMTSIADDGLEPTASEVQSEWFGNVVCNAGLAIRMKNCSVGPAYFYGNKLHAASDPPYRHADRSSSWAGGKGIYFYTETPGTIYIYHNSFQYGTVLSPTGSRRVGTDGFANVWILNNIFSGREFFRKKSMTWNPHFHYNWCGGDAKEDAWMGTENTIAPGDPIWSDADKSLALPKGHAAIGSALDLSRPFTLDGVKHPALPGMTGPDGRGHSDRGAVQGAEKE